MKTAAATAIADLVGENLSPDYIVSGPLDPRVAPDVAPAVAAGVASEAAAAIDVRTESPSAGR
ncbi:malic enzyme [Arthrobacter sp. UYP6]